MNKLKEYYDSEGNLWGHDANLNIHYLLKRTAVEMQPKKQPKRRKKVNND